jgi:hypothetical protein
MRLISSFFFQPFLNIFLYFIFQRNIGSKRVSLASVVTPGSPTKKPYSAVASHLSKAFKGDSFAGRNSNGARNAALEKEGKLFVQVLYPDIFLLLKYLLQPCTSRLCNERVERLFLRGIATTIFTQLHSKKI